MPPVELPDFYMPHQARMNPDLERARTHTKEWAYQMGFLGLDNQGQPSIFDEATFDSVDFGLFSSYAYPDAPGPQLDVVTDWMLLCTFFDDLFLQQFKKPRDKEGAKRYVDRLRAFTPIDLRAPPEATNSVERGLSDLWSRTAEAMSPDWRKRFAQSVENPIQQSLWELDNLSADRVSNPIEYIEDRRRLGFRLPLDLVEYALGTEMPAQLAGTRPMRVLVDAIVDSTDLRNDILSYQREIEEEGEMNNGVLVAERFLDLTAQEAVNTVNELITSRMHQFENIAITDIPLLLDEYRLDPPARATVLRYVQGLQDWQAGVHEWHLQSSRYTNTEATVRDRAPDAGARRESPTGMGRVMATDAKDGAGSPGAVSPGPFEIPPFSMPYPSRLNPSVDSARQHATAWAREMGMLEERADWLGVGASVERRFDAMDFGLFASLTVPDASIRQLELVTSWHVWSFFVDEFFVEAFKRTGNLAGANEFLSRLSAFLPDDLAGMPVTTNTVERGLADLWYRTVPALPPHRRHWFGRHLLEFVGSWLWELSNLIEKRTSDPVDYVEMRRQTSGARFAVDLIQLALGTDIPAEMLAARPMRTLLGTFSDVGPLRNDILSYREEIDRGEINNAVVVVERFLDRPLEDAVKVVAQLLEARLEQFQRVVGTDLLSFLDEQTLDPRARLGIPTLVAGLEAWMAGELKWQMEIGRGAIV